MIIWPHDLRTGKDMSDWRENEMQLIWSAMPFRALCDTCGSESSEALVMCFHNNDHEFNFYNPRTILAIIERPEYLAVFAECGHVRSSWMREITRNNEPIFSIIMKEVSDDPPRGMSAAFARLGVASRSLGEAVLRELLRGVAWVSRKG